MLLPSLRARDPREHHRASTQLELMFDLISVIAIAAATAMLHRAIPEGEGAAVLPRFAFVFIGIWWCWMNFTWFASAFDDNGPLYQLTVMVIMAGELLFAAGVGSIALGLDLSWGLLGWCIMRAGMAFLWYRASLNPPYRKVARLYMWGILLAQLCWVVGFLALGQSRWFLPVASLIYLVELGVPAIAESVRRTPFHREHIIERYGLLTIISLGEIMLAVSTGFGALYGPDPEWATAQTALAGLVIAFAVFWVYFAPEPHMPRADLPNELLWGYGHVLVFGSIAILGAGISAEIELARHPAPEGHAAVSHWLGVPLAVLFGMLWLIRDRHCPMGWRALSLPVMALASLGGTALGLSVTGFAALALLAGVWHNGLLQPAADD